MLKESTWIRDNFVNILKELERKINVDVDDNEEIECVAIDNQIG